MSIRITWSNVNAAIADGIRVYRSTSPIDPNDLPAPLIMLAGDALGYEDTAVVNNTFYYYRFGFFKGDDELLSEEHYYGHFADTGPGPSTLLRGDWKRGYFGRVPITDMITAANLATAVGYATGSANSDTNLTHWLKFVFNQKILYIPNAYVRSSATFRSLYEAGLVYGTDDNGTYPAGASSALPNPTLQDKKVTIASRQYRVRLMTNSALPTDQYAATDAAFAGGEFIQLYAAASASPSRSVVPPRWDDLAQLPISAVMHFNNAAQIGTMGGGSPSDASSYVSLSNICLWTPVLELIP